MEEKKIIICSENSNTKKSEFTFKRYLHSIGEFKWWIIAFTLVFTIIGYLFATLVYNPKKQSVSYNFTYDIAINKVTSTPKDKTETPTVGYFYVDGTPYNYSNIISEKAIQAVKEKNPSYAGVSDDDIMGALSISPVMVNDAPVPFQYVLNCSVRPFKTAENASFFVKELINYTKDYSQSLVSSLNLSDNLSSSFAEYSFAQQITALTNQYKYILGVYSNLESQFPYASAQIGEKTYALDTLSEGFRNQYSSGSSTIFDQYQASFSRNKYLNYTVGEEESVLKDLYAIRDDELSKMNAIEGEVKVYQESISNLSSQLSGSQITLAEGNVLNDSQKKIDELRLTQNEIKYQLDILGYETVYNSGKYELRPLASGQIIYLESLVSSSPSAVATQWKQDNQVFASNLNRQYQNLKKDSDTASSAYRYLYQKNKNEVTYTDMGSVNGGMNKYVVAVGFAVLTFIVSSLICTGVSINNSHKKKEEETAVATTSEENTTTEEK